MMVLIQEVAILIFVVLENYLLRKLCFGKPKGHKICLTIWVFLIRSVGGKVSINNNLYCDCLRRKTTSTNGKDVVIEKGEEMKVTRLLISVIAISIIFSEMAVAIENPDEQIIIEGGGLVGFDHDTHLRYGLKCGVCHHKSKDVPFTDQEVISQSSGLTLHCVYCHNKNFKNEKLRNLKRVMHRHCKECHQKGIDGVKGPTKCIDCHKTKKE